MWYLWFVWIGEEEGRVEYSRFGQKLVYFQQTLLYSLHSPSFPLQSKQSLMVAMLQFNHISGHDILKKKRHIFLKYYYLKMTLHTLK